MTKLCHILSLKSSIKLFLMISTILSCLGLLLKNNTNVEIIENDGIDLDALASSRYSVCFHVVNKTIIPMKVRNCIPSCECMHVQYDSRYIWYNDTLSINVSLEPEQGVKGKLYREIEMYGNFDSPIYLCLEAFIK